MSKLILTMICRSEAKIIRRCIESAEKYVDGFAICDTGSTDGTHEILEEFFLKQEKPFSLQRQPWVNFGHNRTLSFMEAKELASLNGWHHASSFALLLDADMTLREVENFDASSLTEPAYYLTQKNGNLSYHNTRLIRLSHEWRAIGATHEYWSSTPDCTPQLLTSLIIDDHNDGGSKGDKAERDIRLLEEEWNREPNNPRTAFYLGQTYFDTGRWSDARKAYESRRDLGGWEEERWYALYKLAQIDMLTATFIRGMGHMLQAAAERPTRAEPWVWLATYFRKQGHNELAWMLADKAASLQLSSTGLFLERDAYEIRPWEELMITTFYVLRPDGSRNREFGMKACEKLATLKDKDSGFHDYVARNSRFYLKPIEQIRMGWLSPNFESEEPEDKATYRATNPSMCKHNGIIYTNLRWVNYEQQSGKYYTTKDDDGVIRTKNELTYGSADDEKKFWEWSPETSQSWPETRIVGMEDVRLFSFQGKLMFTATCCQVPGKGGWPQVVMGSFDNDAKAEVFPLTWDHSLQCEKNWLPWVLNDELFLIYSYDPFIVLQPGLLTGGHCALRSSWVPPFAAARWRGSAGPVKAHGRWFAIVHEKAFFDNEIIYMHRWIEISEDFKILRFSPPFVFDHVGVEYACGLIFNPLEPGDDDASFTVTYGSEDREARFVEVAYSTVVEMLESGDRE